jgi:hypothetical protein
VAPAVASEIVTICWLVNVPSAGLNVGIAAKTPAASGVVAETLDE